MLRPALSLALALTALLGCSTPKTPISPPGPSAVRTASGLTYEDPKPGNGDEAERGDTVAVHYTGWLEDGTEFDTSRSRGQAFEFELGAGAVIKGWDEGVAGMRVGGQRRLFIPAALGYGDRGAGGVIPPGAALVFDVELIEIRP